MAIPVITCMPIYKFHPCTYLSLAPLFPCFFCKIKKKEKDASLLLMHGKPTHSVGTRKAKLGLMCPTPRHMYLTCVSNHMPFHNIEIEDAALMALHIYAYACSTVVVTIYMSEGNE